MKRSRTKKVVAMVTGMILALSLAACGSQGSSAQTNEGQTEAENQAEETAQAGEDNNETAVEEAAQTTDGGKTLVVYYSATGHTESVAGYIAAATDADIFVLEPVEPYSREDLDWTNENSRVSQEHENPEARNVELVAATVH